MSGFQFVMLDRLVRKFVKAGATSIDKAVSFQEANLNEQEQYWLEYFAGAFLGKIKKTKNGRYYLSSATVCGWFKEIFLIYIFWGGKILSGSQRASKKTDVKMQISKYLYSTNKKRALARRKHNKMRVVADKQKS